MSVIKLPYLSDIYGAVHATPTGMFEIGNVDYYNGVSIRNNVVVRIDILSGLSSVFSVDIREKYRNLIYQLVSGNLQDKQKISDVLIALYREDEVFKKFLGNIVYFSTEMETTSLYDLIIKESLTAILKCKEDIKAVIAEKNYRPMFEHKGYLYFAIPDMANTVLYVPAGYKEEVITRAKIWRGMVQRF